MEDNKELELEETQEVDKVEQFGIGALAQIDAKIGVRQPFVVVFDAYLIQ